MAGRSNERIDRPTPALLLINRGAAEGEASRAPQSRENPEPLGDRPVLLYSARASRPGFPSYDPFFPRDRKTAPGRSNHGGGEQRTKPDRSALETDGSKTRFCARRTNPETNGRRGESGVRARRMKPKNAGYSHAARADRPPAKRKTRPGCGSGPPRTLSLPAVSRRPRSLPVRAGACARAAGRSGVFGHGAPSSPPRLPQSTGRFPLTRSHNRATLLTAKGGRPCHTPPSRRSPPTTPAKTRQRRPAPLTPPFRLHDHRELTRTLRLRLQPDDAHRLQKIATNHGLTLSALIRRAIGAYISRGDFTLR